MRDAGKFKLFINKEKQRISIKEEISYGDYYSTPVEIRYILKNGNEVWTCPSYTENFSEPRIEFKEAEPMELSIPEK